MTEWCATVYSMDHAFGAWLAGVVIKDNIITEWFFFFVEKPQRAVTVQCIECKKVRRFPCTNPDYKIWIEKFQDLSQNASWFETEDYLHYTGKANLLWHWISNGRQLSGKVGHSITSPCSYWFHIHCKCTSAEAVTQCVLFIYLEIIFFLHARYKKHSLQLL